MNSLQISHVSARLNKGVLSIRLDIQTVPAPGNIGTPPLPPTTKFELLSPSDDRDPQLFAKAEEILGHTDAIDAFKAADAALSARGDAAGQHRLRERLEQRLTKLLNDGAAGTREATFRQLLRLVCDLLEDEGH